MEEKRCCEKGIECCPKMCSLRCPMINRCHSFKWLILAVIIVIAFCLGSCYGKMHSVKKSDFYFQNHKAMMNWTPEQIQAKKDAYMNAISDKMTDGVAVEVN